MSRLAVAKVSSNLPPAKPWSSRLPKRLPPPGPRALAAAAAGRSPRVVALVLCEDAPVEGPVGAVGGAGVGDGGRDAAGQERV